ncbi:MAG: hypothetical protein WBG37_22365 [Desulfobacterales bacterium]
MKIRYLLMVTILALATAGCAWNGAPGDPGSAVQYMVKQNEGHGFENEENRFDFDRAMERFLAEHLGSRREPRAHRSK